jgi:hypothetical protein
LTYFPLEKEKSMNDYLSFRRMITPIIIQVIFWIGVALTILAALAVLVRGFTGLHVTFATIFGGLIGAAVTLVVGIIAVRVWCEILIVFFRINETLTDIREGLVVGPRPAAPPTVAPPPGPVAPPPVELPSSSAAKTPPSEPSAL